MNELWKAIAAEASYQLLWEQASYTQMQILQPMRIPDRQEWWDTVSAYPVMMQ